MRMLTLALWASALLVAYSSLADDLTKQTSAAATVERIRRLPARVLDGALPDVPLEQWILGTLQTLGPLTWEISDCDLKPPPHRTCVTARSTTRPGEIGIRLHIIVDTFQPGPATPSIAGPSFIWLHRTSGLADTLFRDCLMNADSLGELRTNAVLLRRKRECQ